MAVPKTMQTKYDEISAIIVSYCDQYLNDEFKALCLHALEKLCRKRPSPLISGRSTTWAAGIIYAICQNNWIFDHSRPIHYSADELVAPIGISKNTASSKANEIRKTLKISHFNAEWMLASDIDENPIVWMILVDGVPVDARTLPLEMQRYCADRGLIPYVPGER